MCLVTIYWFCKLRDMALTVEWQIEFGSLDLSLQHTLTNQYRADIQFLYVVQARNKY
jgi:hypothetical protein